METNKIGVVGALGLNQFVPAPFILLDNEQIDISEKGLFILLCRYKNKLSSKCWPSLSTLKKKTGLTEKTILKKLAILEEVGLIKKKNNVYNSKQNNTYILYDPAIVFGYRQLNIKDLTEEEVDTLQEIGKEYVIEKPDGTIIVCHSEKNKFFLNLLYQVLDNYAKAILETNTYSDVEVIIQEIRFFYERIASLPVIFFNKAINEDTEKISSEEYLEKIRDFNIDKVVETVRRVNLEGVPKEYEDMDKNTYILNLLWAERLKLTGNILQKVIEQNKQVNLKTE